MLRCGRIHIGKDQSGVYLASAVAFISNMHGLEHGLRAPVSSQSQKEYRAVQRRQGMETADKERPTACRCCHALESYLKEVIRKTRRRKSR
ncbi:hypothetical protein NDU88_003767 [Pleurodeles waltl]|uniref:Uncharacterized protein n=1 Tax=Pleurodeles waltl TaxID=8319 RepID=A0AAV7KWE7_PLEWA|nr:hypothetical protein NDU88_003767 [Pleurodeles waltl]